MISLDGKPLEHWSLKETASKWRSSPNSNQLQFDCTVEEIVLLGRTPHLLFLQKEGDREIMPSFKMLVKVDMLEKKTRLYSSLFRGEKQRVLLALCLGARTDSLAPRRTNQSPRYQVPARLVGHCEGAQGQCSSCPCMIFNLLVAIRIISI